MTYLIRISFSGATFYGTQKQNSKPSLQGAFERLLGEIYQVPVKVSISSRLDRFVSAEDFALSYVPKDDRLSPQKLAYVINRRLAPEVYVKSVQIVPDGFSVRYGMDYKIYRYALQKKPAPYLNPISLPVEEGFDFDSFQEGMLLFVGKHDFRSFSSPEGEENTVLTLDRITFEENGPLFYTRIQAKSFLRYQIRFLIGAGILYARKKITASLLTELLSGKEVPYPRTKVPGQGLVLEKISYPGLPD